MSSNQHVPEETIDRAIVLMRESITLRNAAAAVGLSAPKLRAHLMRRGLSVVQLHGPRDHPDVLRRLELRVDRAIDLIRDGASLATAAAAVEMNTSTLNGRLQRRGLSVTKLRRPLRIRADAPAFVVHPQHVEDAIARIAAGETLTAVAADIGVSRQTLHRHLAKRGMSVRQLRRDLSVTTPTSTASSAPG